MGWLPVWAQAAAVAPRAVNALAHAPGLSKLVKTAGGVAQQRELPKFATQQFTSWFRSRSPRRGERGAIVLWPDTFTNNFHPGIGRAAVEVLEAAGYSVIVPRRRGCCGLTWISTGQLSVAERVLRRTLDILRPALRHSIPVVVLEPSCAAVFRSDLPDLLHGDEDAHRLADQTSTLAEALDSWQPPHVGGKAIVQPHCHQHAVLGTDADLKLLSDAGVDAEKLDAGCCGLAGNFGFESEHYDVSMACAEDKLLPAVRAADPDTLVLADGFSCRTQIEQAGTGRKAVHLAEVLAGSLRDRP
jgi:Fe-S oxidoreductase